nr:hypothetical protein [Tanacetum cinerariifolium]
VTSLCSLSHIVEDFVKRLRYTLGEEGGSLLNKCLTIYMHQLRGSVYKLLIYKRPLLDDYKKGKKFNDLQFIMCGDMFKKIIGQGEALKNVKFRSCGGKGGINPWKFTLEDGGTFTKITILSIDDCVYSIMLKQDSPTYGGKTSSGTTKTLNIYDEEYVTGISGTMGKYNGITVITSLSIRVGYVG